VKADATTIRGIAAALMLSVSLAAAGAPLPHHNLTPGDALQVTPEQVCAPGYAKSVRHVAGKVKAQVYSAYGIADHDGYAIDHLIAVELGGSNSVRNLWPQRFEDADKKDRLENHLHALVCGGAMPLAEAQSLLASDWAAAYRKYFRDSR
jgi:hypothetical protein